MQEKILKPVGNIQPFQQHEFNSDDSSSIWTRKTSAMVSPLPTRTSEKENWPVKPLCLTPVLPDSKLITHNITRMLPGTQIGDSFLTSTPEPLGRGRFPVYQPHLLSNNGQSAFRPLTCRSPKEAYESSSSMVDYIDTDSSSYNQSGTLGLDQGESVAPPSQKTSPESKSPAKSVASPESGCGSGTSPEPDCPPARKKARTSYRPDQLKVLERQFQENPYPDADRIETLSKDLEIAESKLRIWFQNKRARWRRRVNNNMNSPYNSVMPMSPIMPQMPYGFIQPSPFMTSSPSRATPFIPQLPPQGMPGFIPSQEPFSPYGNQIQNNQINTTLQNSSQAFTGQQSTSVSMPSHSLATSPHYASMTSTPQTVMPNNYRQLSYAYSNSFGTFSQS